MKYLKRGEFFLKLCTPLFSRISTKVICIVTNEIHMNANGPYF